MGWKLTASLGLTGVGSFLTLAGGTFADTDGGGVLDETWLGGVLEETVTGGVLAEVFDFVVLRLRTVSSAGNFRVSVSDVDTWLALGRAVFGRVALGVRKKKKSGIEY